MDTTTIYGLYDATAAYVDWLKPTCRTIESRVSPYNLDFFSGGMEFSQKLVGGGALWQTVFACLFLFLYVSASTTNEMSIKNLKKKSNGKCS